MFGAFTPSELTLDHICSHDEGMGRESCPFHHRLELGHQLKVRPLNEWFLRFFSPLY